jgi:hypothetical protein
MDATVALSPNRLTRDFELQNRVFWRDVWTPDWQHEVLVGDITEFVMRATNIDDLVFGVAAVGSDGT